VTGVLQADESTLSGGSSGTSSGTLSGDAPTEDGRPRGRPPSRGFAPGRRSTGKIIRDTLLIVVILAMGLPFVMARVGAADLTAEQEEWAKLGRRAAFERQDWLANSMSNKVSSVSVEGDGHRFEYRYYTFFGIPWGSSVAYVGADGSVGDVSTSLTVARIF
jgi:hypothetical protein